MSISNDFLPIDGERTLMHVKVLALFHGPPDAAGVTASGGTESILMACYGARQKAYAERGVTAPEMYGLIRPSPSSTSSKR